MFNPFHLTGWEAMVTTGIVCFTVYTCFRIAGTTTIQTATVICQACETFSNAVANAITVVFTEKNK